MNADHPLADFKLIDKRKVVWGDMDAMRHVNNTKYFFYCETARIEFLQSILSKGAFADPENRGIGIALAETSCRFKVSLTYPDNLEIGTAVTKIEDNQFHLRHAIYSEKLNRIAAEATARMVVFNFATGQRSPVDDEMLSKLKQFSI